MTGHNETSESWTGLCRKCPGMHAAPAGAVCEPEQARPAAPYGGGPAGRSGSIRDGISLAVASLRALLRDRRLFWFAFVTGLIMLFLVLVEGWNHRYIDPAFPAVFVIGGRTFSVSMQYLFVAIPIGQAHFIFYFGFFLLEAVCFFGFSAVLAGIILHRAGGGKKCPATVRETLSAIRPSLGSLAVLSLVMAFIATISYELIFTNAVFSGIISNVMMLFWLPWAYYNPHNWMLSALFYSATYISVSAMAVNTLLFIAVLILAPAIVLEKKGLVDALGGSVPFLKRTWRELAGCLVVCAVILLGIFTLGVIVGQLPALLNHDYDFFISASRGYLPMMAVCYGLIAAFWVLMAAGFAAAGVAIADLYTAGTSGQAPESGM